MEPMPGTPAPPTPTDPAAAGPPPDPGKVTGLRVAKVLTWLVYAYFLVAVILLVLEFFLLLFNANPTAGFAEWVYRSGDRVMEPFRGIFPTKQAGNGSVLDFAVLFAIIVYGVLALAFHSLVEWLDYRIRVDRWRAANPGQVPPPRR